MLLHTVTVIVLTVFGQLGWSYSSKSDSVYHWNLTGEVLLFCDADTSQSNDVLVSKGVFLLDRDDSLISTTQIRNGRFHIHGL